MSQSSGEVAPVSWYAVTFDCADPYAVASFWAAALCRDVADFSTPDHVILVPKDDSRQPRIVFNRVPEPKTVKNRVHVDIATMDFDCHTMRLTELGATRITDYDFEDSRWSTFLDVEGNEFDLIDITRRSPGAG